MEDFGDFIKLVVWIIIIAASVLGPMVERWRRKKEEERLRRRSQEGAQTAPEEAPPEPEPAQRSALPYEDLVQEVFGPYIERRKRAAAEARRQASPVTEEADEEEDLDEEIRELRETRRPEPVPFDSLPPEPHPAPAMAAQLASEVPVVTSSARQVRTLDERLFSNPHFSAGAKLVLASEILGRPKGLRR